jgi:protease PrsW
METKKLKNDSKKVKFTLIASILYVFATLVGLAFYLGTSNPVIAVIAGSLMAVLPVPLYVFGVYLLDRKEPEPKILLFLTFVWGATIAILISLVINTAVMNFLGLTASSIISAPITEEISKGAAIFLLFFLRRKNLDSILDGIVYGAMVGLGFAMTENIFYYVRSLSASGITGGLSIFWTRGVMTPYAHPLFTMMTGIGFAISANTDNDWLRKKAPVFGIITAIVLHAVWNGSNLLGAGGFAVIYYLLFIPILILVVAGTWVGIFKKEG